MSTEDKTAAPFIIEFTAFFISVLCMFVLLAVVLLIIIPVAMAAGSPATAIPQPALNLTFDNINGTHALDTSGNSNHGVLKPTSLLGPVPVEGISGGDALNFDGVDDYVSVPHDGTLGVTDSLTFAFWIYPTRETQQTAYLAEKEGAYSFWESNGTMYFALFHNGTSFGTVSAAIVQGTWTHVAATYERGERITLYVNGAPSQRTGSYNHTIDTNAHDLSIGNRFNGTLDSILLYDMALSEDDIKDLYNSSTAAGEEQTPPPAVYTLGLSPVIRADSPQDSLGLESPADILSDAIQGYRHVPAFLAIDRLSTEENDRVHFVLACRNEGDEAGPGTCSLNAVGGSAGDVFYSGCEDERHEGNGITVCEGSFRVNSENSFILLTATAGSGGNSLFFKLPANKREYGIITLFNTPNLTALPQNFTAKDIPFYHPFVTDAPASVDYGLYDWTLTGLAGVLDGNSGNEVTRYVVNSKSFLPGEGVLAYTDMPNASIALYDEDGTKLQENAVLDPGFDEGLLADWAVGQGTWLPSSDAHSGKYSLHTAIITDEGEYRVYQKTGAFPGVTYNLSAWIKTTNVELGEDGTGAYVGAKAKNATGDTLAAVSVGGVEGTTGWSRYSGTITSTTDTDHIRLLARLDNSRGDTWFDDISLTPLGGRAHGAILWLPAEGGEDGAQYNISSNDISRQIRVEPAPDIRYEGEEADWNGVVAGRDFPVKSEVTVISRNAYRPQTLALSTNMRYPADYVEGTCKLSVDGTPQRDCDTTLALVPDHSLHATFSWLEHGVKLTSLGVEQDFSKISTPELQYLTQNIRLTNTHSSRGLRNIKGYIRLPNDAICENPEDTEKIDWVSEWAFASDTLCYFELGDSLDGGGSSADLFLGFSGDFLDVESGTLEQDPEMQSSLETQYLRLPATLTQTGKISRGGTTADDMFWRLSVDLCDEIPGESTDCSRTLPFEKTRPILILTFDEGEGTIAKDTSGNKNHGILMPNESAGPMWVEGKAEKALQFDGADDYVKVPDSPVLNSRREATVCAWAKPSDNTSEGGVFDKGGNYMVHSNMGTWRVIWISTGADYKYTTGKDAYTQGEWQHLCTYYSLSKNETGLYVNGVKEASMPLDGHELTDETGNPFTVGKRDAGGQWFRGSVDDVKFYDRLLPESYIRELYNGADEPEELSVSIHSRVSTLDYGVGKPERIESPGDSRRQGQFWVQNITVTNSLSVPFFDISGAFDTGLATILEEDTLNSSQLTNLGLLNDSGVSFVIPAVEANSGKTFTLSYVAREQKEEETQREDEGLQDTTNTANDDLSTTTGLLLAGGEDYIGALTAFLVTTMGTDDASHFGRYDLSEDLVLYLDFEGGGTMIHDSSGKLGDGTISGNPRWAVGHEGLALYFDGEDDYVEVPDPAALNFDREATISVWLKASSATGGGLVSTSGTPHFMLHDMGLNEPSYRYIFTDAGGTRWRGTSTGTLSPGEWHHIVATYSATAGEAKIYADGELKGVEDIDGLPLADFSELDLWVGKRHSGGDACFKGTIDEVRIYSRALSEAEVRVLYRGNEGVTLAFFQGSWFTLLFLAAILILLSIISYLELRLRR